MKPPPHLRFAQPLLLAAAIAMGGGCSPSRGGTPTEVAATGGGGASTLGRGGASGVSANPGSGEGRGGASTAGGGAGGQGGAGPGAGRAGSSPEPSPPLGGASAAAGGAEGGLAGTPGSAAAGGISGSASSAGGSGPDAGSDGAPDMSAPPPPPPPGTSAACSGLFCEDFEKGVIDPAIWDVEVNGGQPAPALVSQAGLVAHGRYAAHFHANPSVVSYDFIITKSPPPGLSGHHFGRAYFMVTPMPPTNHTEFIYAGTTGFPRYQYLEVASVATSTWQLTYVDEVPPVTGEDYHSGGKIPLGRWFCLEWELSDAPDRAVVYVDGVQSFAEDAFSYGGSMTGLVGGFAAFGFGYYAWHPATYAFDLYYDDIVLDTKRVGCLE
jgi:hypothetical protein